MAKNKLQDLNNHLFECIENIMDYENTEEELDTHIRRAKAVADISKVIIDGVALAVTTAKFLDSGGVNNIDTNSIASFANLIEGGNK